MRARTQKASFSVKTSLWIGPDLSHLSLGVCCIFRKKGCLLLSGPVHELVSDEHRDGPVEDLALGSAVGVEDGGVCGTSESTLAVLGHRVGDDAALRRGA